MSNVNTVGVTNMLDQEYDPMFVVDDQEYRLYLHDHKQIILDSCEKVKLTHDQWAKYQYRPKWYLREHNHPVQSDWLVLWLNDMSASNEFTYRDEILIPNYTTIEELYNTYRTLKSRHITALQSLYK